jgi:hypothetical protein
MIYTWVALSLGLELFLLFYGKLRRKGRGR